jgi:hypothetical protein
MDDFKATINRLWGALGLSIPPRFGEEPSISLTIDGVDLQIAEAPDGRHLIVRAPVDSFAEDPLTRERQIRDILKANLAHLFNCRAGACLEKDASGRSVLVVEAVYAYAARDINLLGGLIEHALRLREAHAARLGAPQGRGFGPATAPEGDALIFRL